MIPASTPDRTRPSSPLSAIVPITEPTAPPAIITGRSRVYLASARWLHTSQPLATTPGMAITTTERSTPRNAAMTGIAICGSPPPVAPLMKAPMAIAVTMTTRSRLPAPFTAGAGGGVSRAPPWSRGPVQPGEDELPVAEHLGGRPAAARRRHDEILRQVGGLVERHVLGDDARHIEVDVLRHGRRGPGVGGQLEHRHDRVADDVALAGREQVQGGTAGGEERDGFGRRRRG